MRILFKHVMAKSERDAVEHAIGHSVCADCVRVVFDSLRCTVHVIFFNFNFVVMRIEEDIRHLKVRTWHKTPQRGQQLPVILASDKRQKRRVNDNSFLISFAVFSTEMKKNFSNTRKLSITCRVLECRINCGASCNRMQFRVVCNLMEDLPLFIFSVSRLGRHHLGV